ncbi:MAG: hypothetical protein E6J91_08275 [Deltaproteobacteria bacterium]|nr:MAG: hypothetical protein E6J91_08275 [Deltaproteobacteria bacterium]
MALLSKNDSAHDACVGALDSFRGHLITAEPVLTEAMHLVRRQLAMTAERLASCKTLIARHRDVPMDFADATLVAVAEELGIATVFTLDRRGFATYRWRKTRRFEIVP